VTDPGDWFYIFPAEQANGDVWCDTGSGFVNCGTVTYSTDAQSPTLPPSNIPSHPTGGQFGSGAGQIPPTLFHLTLPGMNYCGPGNAGGPPTNDTDTACEHHDACYNAAGASWFNASGEAVRACNAQLCVELAGSLPQTRMEAGENTVIQLYFDCFH
jgi:hypothetical protein